MKNLSNFKDKEFWKKELKKISLSDILIWIAIILVFVASWQNINAGNDPCSYCMMNRPDYEGGDISCRDYFNSGVSETDLETYEIFEGNFNVTSIPIKNENITGNNTG